MTKLEEKRSEREAKRLEKVAKRVENIKKRMKLLPLTPQNFIELDGTITNRFEYDSYKKICIITEDGGNGYQFYLSYIVQNYKFMSGSVVGAIGKDTVADVLELNPGYEYYILILDRGISPGEYTTILNRINTLKKNNEFHNARFWLFQPNCVEEVFLSFYKLSEYIDTNKSVKGDILVQQFREVLEGKRNKIKYEEFKDLNGSTPEQLCEKYIYELTQNTPFEAYHGQKEIKGVQQRIPAYLSYCWRCPCCTVKDFDKVGKIKLTDCKKVNEYNMNHSDQIENENTIIMSDTNNKLDYIAQNSLLCGLTYILDSIYGYKFREKYWNRIDKNYLSELVKEI